MATNTAASFTNHTGNASAGPFSISFSYLDESEVDVTVDGVLKTKTTHYTFPSATTISFTSGNHPASGAAIKFQRDTDVSAKKVDFQDGSVLTETDLDNNSDQILYGLQENLDVLNNDVLKRDGSQTVTGNLVFEGATDNAHETTLAITDPTADRTITVPDITGTVVTTGDTGTVTSTMINNGTIVADDLASNSVTTAKITDANVTTAKVADDAITSAKIADNAITSAHIADGTVVAADIGANAVTASELADDAVDTAAIANSAVTNAKLGADAVNGSKIADDSIDSEHYVDGSIDTAHIADLAITGAKIATDTITSGKLAVNAVSNTKLAANAVQTVKIADNAVTTAKINADAVDGTKIADDSIDSEHYVDGSIGTAHIANTSVTTAKLANDAVTTVKITDANITTAKLADDAVTAAKIADGAITSAHIAADTVVAADIAANAVTASELADNAVDTAAIADSAVTTAKIADSAVTTAKIGTFNLADLTNVHTSSPNDGQVLKWINSNSRWEPANDAGAGGATLADADYGDITVSSSGAVFTIDNDVITSAKIADDAVGAEHIEVLDAALQFGDSVKAQFGAGNDLELYHNGTHSFIDEKGTGNLYVSAADQLHLRRYATNETFVKCVGDGAVELYYNNIKTFNTNGDGISVLGTEGGSAILYLLADEGDDNADKFRLVVDDGGYFFIQNVYSGSWETNFKATGDAAVDLYYDNSLKAKTYADGFRVNGDFWIDNQTNTGKDIWFDESANTFRAYDDVKFTCGNSDDLQIYHDGTDNIILSNGASCDLLTYVANGELAVKAVANGAVELYYDNSKKLNTHTEGVEVLGKLYMADNKNIELGNSQDLKILHDSSGDSYIQDKGSGNLYITGDDIIIQNNDTSENIAKFIENGAVELYYDGVKKCETYADGLHIGAGGNLDMPHDSSQIVMGAGDDLKIFHDGTNSNINNSTGTLKIGCSNNIEINTFDGHKAAKFINDGAVELYNNGVKKMETTATGITVYTAVNETSDIALKKDITLLSNSLANLKQLKGYSYKFKDTDHPSIGLIAQEVEKVYPDLVQGEEGSKTLQYSGFIGPLLEAIKELSAEVDTLKTKVTALESA